MKLFNCFTCALFLFVSCIGTNRVKKEFLHEKKLPVKVIAQYEKKLGLPALDKGAKEYEMRIWTAITHDSFPLMMERYYIENGVLKGDFFMFHTENKLLIERGNQLDSIAVEKLAIGTLPNRFKETLKLRHSIFNIKDFDTHIFAEEYKAGWVIGKISLILIEQATNSQYKSVFITNPIPFEDRNQSLSEYADLCRFVNDSLLTHNTDASGWSDVQLAKIINSGFGMPQRNK
jgi:hypothetical protein